MWLGNIDQCYILYQRLLNNLTRTFSFPASIIVVFIPFGRYHNLICQKKGFLVANPNIHGQNAQILQEMVN